LIATLSPHFAFAAMLSLFRASDSRRHAATPFSIEAATPMALVFAAIISLMPFSSSPLIRRAIAQRRY